MPDIKQKIILDGEKEYNAALKEAQRNLKVLRSEMKAETAELGKNATAQEKNAAKVKNLQKQIAEQEKVVKTYEAALKEVREKYADNEDAIAKWEVKLNDARTALANMKNSIEDVGKAFDNVDQKAELGTVATKSFADSLGSLASIGDSISTSIENVFTGMVGTITQTVEQLWQLISETAAKANSWTDLSAVFGTTATNVEQLYRAISGVGGSGKFDSFISMMTRLSYGGKEKTIAELLGVSDVNYEDKMEYALAVMDAMQKYKETHSKNQTDDMMAEIFGAKKSADVTWLLENWNAILDKREEYAEKGYNMDADEIETMNQVQLKLNDIEAKWEALKDKFAEGFGSVTLDIQAEVSRGLDAIAKFMNAETPEEQEEAIAELEESIIGMFEVVRDAILKGIELLDKLAEQLKESENPTAQALGTILGKLVEALQWITEDNMQHVVDALGILASFWLIGKGAAMAAKIAEMVANINLIKAFSGGSAAAGAAGASGASGAAGLAGAGSALGGLAGLGLIGAGFTWAIDRRQNHAEEVRGTDENLASFAQNDDLKGAFIKYVNAEKALEDLLTSPNYKDDQAEDLMEKVDQAREALNALEGSGELLQAYSDWRQEHSYGNMDWMLPSSDWWQTNGNNNGNSLTSEDISGFKSVPGMMRAAVRDGVSNIKVTIDGQTVGNLVAPYVSQYIARDAG